MHSECLACSEATGRLSDDIGWHKGIENTKNVNSILVQALTSLSGKLHSILACPE